MVSNIRYYSFKDLDFKKPVPFVVLLAVVLGVRNDLRRAVGHAAAAVCGLRMFRAHLGRHA